MQGSELAVSMGAVLDIADPRCWRGYGGTGLGAPLPREFRRHNTQLRQRASGFPAQGRDDEGVKCNALESVDARLPVSQAGRMDDSFIAADFGTSPSGSSPELAVQPRFEFVHAASQ